MFKTKEKNEQVSHTCPVCGKQIPEDQRCCPECEAAYLAFLAM